MGLEDPQKMLKEHKIPSLDVDWLVGARNLDTSSSAAVAATAQLSPSSSHMRSRSVSVDSEDPISEVPSSHGSGNVSRLSRRNSVAASVLSDREFQGFRKDAPDTNEHVDLRRTKSLSAAPADAEQYGNRNRHRGASVSAGSAEAEQFGNRNRRRGASISASSLSSPRNKEKKMGFFKSLFGGKKKEKNEQPPPPPSPPPPPMVVERRNSLGTAPEQRVSQSGSKPPGSRRSSTVLPLQLDGEGGVPLTRSRTESVVHDHERDNSHRHDLADSSHGYKDDMDTGRSSNKNKEGDEDDRDPRLMEFLRYYKAHGYSVSAFNEKHDDYTADKTNGASIRRPKPTNFSIDDSLNGTKDPNKNPVKKKYDARGRPLPAHPNKAPLLPALKSAREALKSKDVASDMDYGSDSDSESSHPSQTTPSSSHKFGAFLRKVTSYGASNSNNATKEEISSNTEGSQDENSKYFDPANATVVPGLEGIKPLKHVSFSTNTYFNDPPQQICSKHPRQGEVEVKPNGSVVIHRLTPEERKKIMESTSAGIVVGGSGQLKLLSQSGDAEGGDARKQEEMAPRPVSPSSVEGSNDDDDDDNKNSQRRNIELAAAEAAAGARAKEAPNELRRIATNNEEDVKVSNIATRVKIDKPMVSRRSGTSQTSLVSMMSQDSASDDETFPPQNIKIPHDVVYTRCCHLREILPIPATLKQLKKGSTDPIPLLQLRNPRPSLVEIWSFSDFLSIAPVLCLSLDGVSLSVEMFRIILSSLMTKRNFEKLSLRNTLLDHEGWKVLCYFVSKSKSLAALDLTMVPIIKTNVQKPSKSSMKNHIARMTCDNQCRKEMNWNLMAASVATKGGLEEVIISGAQMPPDQFENFIEVACIATQRLGLAYNKLTKGQCDALAKWIVQSKVTGLDIGFNDLNGKLSVLNDAILGKIHNKGQSNIFQYISLNCTGLEVGPNDRSENNEALRLISVLCYSENLKFLDISNNPKMFPHCMRTLIDCLPVFVKLVRLNLDYENLSSTVVVMLAEALPLCSKLNYLSMLGTKFDLASCKALAEAVRKSKSLITLDIDYTYMPENIKEKLSLYTMRNVESELDKVKENSSKTAGGKGAADKEQLTNLQQELSILLTDNFKDRKVYDELVERYIERVTTARSKIKKVVKDLFDTRVQGQLSTEGKETLIRLCFIDASFEKGIRLLKQRHQPNTDKLDQGNSEHFIPTSFDTGLSETEPYTKVHGCLVPTSTALSSSTFEQSGHSALLPFGRAEVEEFNPRADDTIELRDKDEDSSKKISSQIREEGNIFKKSDTFLKSIENSTENGASPVDKALIGRAAESLDSDQIKDFLLKTDLSAVVNVIDELHNQGYHLHDIFKKHGETNAKLAALSPQPSPTDEADKKSGTIPSSNAGSSKAAVNNKSSDGTEIVKDEEKAIDAAYDQVLDNIQRDNIQREKGSSDKGHAKSNN